MKEVDYLLLTLKTDRDVNLGASPLSFYISSQYQKQFMQTNRELSGGNYPLVQYKVIRGSPLIVAINEGCDLLWQIYDNLDEIHSSSPYKVLEKRMIERKAEIGTAPVRLKYRFLTPWMTLTEDEIQKAGEQLQQRNRVLTSMLEGNIQAFAHNFKIPMQRLPNLSLNVKEGQIVQKDTGIVGFFGTFFVDFEIPQFLGLGKGVSRGFGTVKQSGN